MFLLINKLQFRISCKNKSDGCETEFLMKNVPSHKMSDLREHELKCRKCPNCKTVCLLCKQTMIVFDYEQHLAGC